MLKPTELLELIRNNVRRGERITIRKLRKILKLDATSEEDRRAVWNLSQTACTLSRERYIDLDTSTGEIAYTLR